MTLTLDLQPVNVSPRSPYADHFRTDVTVVTETSAHAHVMGASRPFQGHVVVKVMTLACTKVGFGERALSLRGWGLKGHHLYIF